MPSTAEAICKQLNAPLGTIPDTWTPDVLKGGHRIGKACYLFSRIEDKKVAEWKKEFGGTAESRAAEEATKKKKQLEKDKKKAKKAAKAQDAGSATGGMTASSAEVFKDLPIRSRQPNQQ
ncbi:hypothetical protein CDD82_3055 [Ophiocordyceps australis]|uniref:Uncharacterized protein n=1 Tax=Ophiocordyceps australis TaxID=1399860 RepID=A0A2C5XUX4_9HYPO|nr:hypothetical protein CDD82_3055 [Ophiocordyceps australis]